jgi:hypothetical protein
VVKEYAKDTKVFEPGSTFTLPDVDQTYTLLAMGFFGKKGERKRPLLKLEAECAVEGCREMFVTSKQPVDLRTPRGIVRTCATHRGKWRTKAKYPWTPGAQRDKLLAAEGDRYAQALLEHWDPKAPKVVKPPKPPPAPKTGSVEVLVLKVLAAADVLGLDEEGVVRTAAAQMPRGTSLQDQRRFLVKRALVSVQRKGLTGSVA